MTGQKIHPLRRITTILLGIAALMIACSGTANINQPEATLTPWVGAIPSPMPTMDTSNCVTLIRETVFTDSQGIRRHVPETLTQCTHQP